MAFPLKRPFQVGDLAGQFRRNGSIPYGSSRIDSDPEFLGREIIGNTPSGIDLQLFIILS